jgi:hypothetical protein
MSAAELLADLGGSRSRGMAAAVADIGDGGKSPLDV